MRVGVSERNVAFLPQACLVGKTDSSERMRVGVSERNVDLEKMGFFHYTGIVFIMNQQEAPRLYRRRDELPHTTKNTI